ADRQALTDNNTAGRSLRRPRVAWEENGRRRARTPHGVLFLSRRPSADGLQSQRPARCRPTPHRNVRMENDADAVRSRAASVRAHGRQGAGGKGNNAPARGWPGALLSASWRTPLAGPAVVLSASSTVRLYGFSVVASNRLCAEARNFSRLTNACWCAF